MWKIDPEDLEDVRAQLAEAPTRTNDVSHLPPPSEAPKSFNVRQPQPPQQAAAAATLLVSSHY